MMMHPILDLGVDVANDAVVVACAEHSFPSKSVPNQRVPLRAWLKSLPAGSRLGLESTGAYHEPEPPGLFILTAQPLIQNGSQNA